MSILNLLACKNLFSDKADCLNSMIDELEKKTSIAYISKSVLRERILGIPI